MVVACFGRYGGWQRVVERGEEKRIKIKKVKIRRVKSCRFKAPAGSNSEVSGRLKTMRTRERSPTCRSVQYVFEAIMNGRGRRFETCERKSPAPVRVLTLFFAAAG